MASSDKDSPTPEDQGVHTAARREKLEKIRQLGIDPWGGRFDDRLLIRELRAQADQVRYQLENGDQLELPELDEDPEKRINLRQWRSDQGPGEEIGPTVRAAGRIQLQRDKGKLRFVDIEDWSGRIQLFIGLRQVGDDAFELAGLFDLGDIIGDLNSRRGNVGGMEQRGNTRVINALVPLAAMFGYVNTLRSMSQGRAQFTMHFDQYKVVPNQASEEIQHQLAG